MEVVVRTRSRRRYDVMLSHDEILPSRYSHVRMVIVWTHIRTHVYYCICQVRPRNVRGDVHGGEGRRRPQHIHTNRCGESGIVSSSVSTYMLDHQPTYKCCLDRATNKVPPGDMHAVPSVCLYVVLYRSMNVSFHVLLSIKCEIHTYIHIYKGYATSFQCMYVCISCTIVYEMLLCVNGMYIYLYICIIYIYNVSFHVLLSIKCCCV
jgi:hypothetical protein